MFDTSQPWPVFVMVTSVRYGSRTGSPPRSLTQESRKTRACTCWSVARTTADATTCGGDLALPLGKVGASDAAVAR